MRELENGFSVSETSDDDGIQSSVPSSRGGLNSIRHSPADILNMNSHFRPAQHSHHQQRAGNQDMEGHVRFEQ